MEIPAYLSRVRLDSGGYALHGDANGLGGSYFGHGEPIYWFRFDAPRSGSGTVEEMSGTFRLSAAEATEWLRYRGDVKMQKAIARDAFETHIRRHYPIPKNDTFKFKN